MRRFDVYEDKESTHKRKTTNFTVSYSSHKQMQCVSHHFNFTKNPILLHDMTGGGDTMIKQSKKYPPTHTHIGLLSRAHDTVS